MKTPKEYKENLENNIFDPNMMGDVLFSFSKRAKNYRDKIGMYTRQYSYENDERNTQKMNEYYKYKSDILEHFIPACIHAVDRFSSPFLVCRDECSIYDDFEYEKENQSYYIKNPCSSCNRKNKKTDVALKRTDYFLFYEIGKHTFHSPIKDITGLNYSISKINDLYVDGEGITDLLSIPFCKKVYQAFIKKN